MKKQYMHTITASSGRDHVLIILFQLYGSKAGLFKVLYSGWVSMALSLCLSLSLSTFILEETLIQY